MKILKVDNDILFSLFSLASSHFAMCRLPEAISWSDLKLLRYSLATSCIGQWIKKEDGVLHEIVGHFVNWLIENVVHNIYINIQFGHMGHELVLLATMVIRNEIINCLQFAHSWFELGRHSFTESVNSYKKWNRFIFSINIHSKFFNKTQSLLHKA